MKRLSIAFALLYVILGLAFTLRPQSVEAKEINPTSAAVITEHGYGSPMAPFSFGLFDDRDRYEDISEICQECGPCPEGCSAGGTGACKFAYAYKECWPGTCITICVYGCTKCDRAGEYEPYSTNTCTSNTPTVGIQTDKRENYKGPVVIYNVGGQIVWRGQWRGRPPRLPKGVYIVRSPDGRFTKRVVIR